MGAERVRGKWISSWRVIIKNYHVGLLLSITVGER